MVLGCLCVSTVSHILIPCVTHVSHNLSLHLDLVNFPCVTHVSHLINTLMSFISTIMLVTYLNVSHTPPPYSHIPPFQSHSSMLVTLLHDSHTSPCQSHSSMLVTLIDGRGVPRSSSLNKLLYLDREYNGEVKKISSSIIKLGLAIWIGAYVFHTCFSYTAQRHAYRVRICFLKSILRQDLAWHDKHMSKDFAAKLTV